MPNTVLDAQVTAINVTNKGPANIGLRFSQGRKILSNNDKKSDL